VHPSPSQAGHRTLLSVHRLLQSNAAICRCVSAFNCPFLLSEQAIGHHLCATANFAWPARYRGHTIRGSKRIAWLACTKLAARTAVRILNRGLALFSESADGRMKASSHFMSASGRSHPFWRSLSLLQRRRKEYGGLAPIHYGFCS
jgi:hypothetical protein